MEETGNEYRGQYQVPRGGIFRPSTGSKWITTFEVPWVIDSYAYVQNSSQKAEIEIRDLSGRYVQSWFQFIYRIPGESLQGTAVQTRNSARQSRRGCVPDRSTVLLKYFERGLRPYRINNIKPSLTFALYLFKALSQRDGGSARRCWSGIYSIWIME